MFVRLARKVRKFTVLFAAHEEGHDVWFCLHSSTETRSTETRSTETVQLKTVGLNLCLSTEKPQNTGFAEPNVYSAGRAGTATKACPVVHHLHQDHSMVEAVVQQTAL